MGKDEKAQPKTAYETMTPEFGPAHGGGKIRKRRKGSIRMMRREPRKALLETDIGQPAGPPGPPGPPGPCPPGPDDHRHFGGVGFTHAINVTNNRTLHDIFSGDGTYAAILMCRTLADAYEKVGKRLHAEELRRDVESMEWAIRTNFSQGGLVNDDDGSVMYSNRRFFVPWGWYANPVSSLSATAWSVMNEDQFNPFVLGGHHNSTTTKAEYQKAVKS